MFIGWYFMDSMFLYLNELKWIILSMKFFFFYCVHSLHSPKLMWRKQKTENNSYDKWKVFKVVYRQNDFIYEICEKIYEKTK